jgi:hypothetical protein
MQCKGIVQGNVVILEEGIYLPDGVHVTVTVEQEEQPEPREITDEEFSQRHALGERMQAFGQRLAGEACAPRRPRHQGAEGVKRLGQFGGCQCHHHMAHSEKAFRKASSLCRKSM